jgi:Fe-S oxidoreductase
METRKTAKTIQEMWGETMVAACKSLNVLLGRLYDRWMDERGYESFKDYTEVMRKAAVKTFPGATFVKGTQRPFGFIVHPVGFPIGAHVICNSRMVSWKNVAK